MLLTIWPGANLQAQVRLPRVGESTPIVLSADSAKRWKQGTEEVWWITDGFEMTQGQDRLEAREAIVWVDTTSDSRQNGRCVVYAEGDVTFTKKGQKPIRISDQTWFEHRRSTGGIRFNIADISGAPETKPTVYDRGLKRRQPGAASAIRRTQYTKFDIVPTPSAEANEPAIGNRRIRVFPRSNAPVDVKWSRSPNTNQSIGIITAGINLIVDGLPGFGSIDVSADRLVLWTEGILDLQGKNAQPDEIPLEMYLEGNIVFRQGERVIYANRMYYDIRNQVGLVLDAEMLTPVPNYEGLLRLRAKAIQQNGESHFFAEEGYFTSSRLGRPGYRLEVGAIEYEDYQHPRFNPITGAPVIDPIKGTQVVDHQQRLTGENGFLYIKDIPVFYWPWVSTNLDQPSYYIDRLTLKNDNVFGNQILTTWDAYELFGIDNEPVGTEWDISLDYLSERGLGHGTSFSYNRDDFFYFPGQSAGLADFWGIKDHGHDNLGRGQRNLALAKSYRYRWFWQHRQRLPYDLQLSAEFGWISDRNFLEEYYEREWDELKDQTTGLELKQRIDNRSWTINADTRLNGFFTQTEWYPRLDHFWLGQSLFDDVFTWYEHSSAAYARYRIASEPEDPAQQAVFNPLPWEITSKGERFVTANEIDWPLQLGPTKVVPYAMTQLAHWGGDLNGEDLQRIYWQAGIRASMPMWRVDPTVESRLLNVHGLAHKVVFDGEFAIAESNQDVDQLPLYDPINDDSIEAFERRMAFLTFGTPTDPIMPRYPAKFDPRYYAIRTGLPGWVTSPTAEVAGDLMAMRMGMRHRWQTKRGMPGSRRIIDWIVFDTNAVWYPDADRDNFGSSFGLLDYNFRWHVGDRLTLVSDGIFDTFDEGQKIFTVGGFLSRPPRGSAYIGLRVMEGPIESQILAMSYNYRMSPKWVSSFGTSFDLGKDGNIGQRLSITRIGESFLISAGFSVDASRGNVGAVLSIEPRFLPKTRLGQGGGVRIPVAGAYGLE